MVVGLIWFHVPSERLIHITFNREVLTALDCTDPSLSPACVLRVLREAERESQPHLLSSKVCGSLFPRLIYQRLRSDHASRTLTTHHLVRFSTLTHPASARSLVPCNRFRPPIDEKDRLRTCLDLWGTELLSTRSSPRLTYWFKKKCFSDIAHSRWWKVAEFRLHVVRSGGNASFGSFLSARI